MGLLFLLFQFSFSQGIVLNGNTIECDGAAVGDSAVIGGKTYYVVDRDALISVVENGNFTYDPPGPVTSATVTPTELSCVCTSNITDMNDLFNRDGVYGKSVFNTNINNWDVSNVTKMNEDNDLNNIVLEKALKISKK